LTVGLQRDEGAASAVDVAAVGRSRRFNMGQARLDGAPDLAMLAPPMGSLRRSAWLEALRRASATGCVALVFALGLFAASPTLHHQLHAGAPGQADDECAVVLFATGVSVAVPVTAQPPVPAEWLEPLVAPAERPVSGSPRFLLPPECGPPVC
jgi:hypothetical protein